MSFPTSNLNSKQIFCVDVCPPQAFLLYNLQVPLPRRQSDLSSTCTAKQEHADSQSERLLASPERDIWETARPRPGALDCSVHHRGWPQPGSESAESDNKHAGRCCHLAVVVCAVGQMIVPATIDNGSL